MGNNPVNLIDPDSGCSYPPCNETYSGGTLDTVVIEVNKAKYQGSSTDWAGINNLNFLRQYNGSVVSYEWKFPEFYGKTSSEQRAIWNFKYGEELTRLYDRLDEKARNQKLLDKLLYFTAHFEAIEDVAYVFTR